MGWTWVTRKHSNGNGWYLWARVCIRDCHLATMLTETYLPSTRIDNQNITDLCQQLLAKIRPISDKLMCTNFRPIAQKFNRFCPSYDLGCNNCGQ